MGGLQKFILRGNLIDLAVAVVVGAQFSGLINQFVTSFVTPLLALFGGNPDLSRLTFTISDSTFKYGAFLTAVISFLIAATVIYFVIVMPVARLIALFDRDKAASERDCPYCLSQIPIAARRCAHCTQEVPPAAEMPRT